MCSKSGGDKNALDDSRALCEGYLKIYEKFEMAKAEIERQDGMWLWCAGIVEVGMKLTIAQQTEIWVVF